MGVNTKSFDNASDMITFSRASGGYGLTKVSYGNELVTNGDFATDLTGWTNSNWTWSSGAAATTGVFGTLTQAVGARTAPKQISIEYVKTSGRVQCQLIDSTAANATVALGGANDLSTLGASPLTVVIPAGYDTIRFTTTDATASWTIDNISVKEVTYNSSDPSATLKLIYHFNDVPRIEYNTDGTSKGLLVEESRTNLVVQSNLSNWITAGGASISTNYASSPENTQNATALIANSIDCRAYVAKTLSGSGHTFSVYAKKGENRYLMLRLSASGGQYRRYFDLQDGVLASETGSGSASSIQEVKDGWYRCSITTADTPTSSQNVLLASTNQDGTETGSVTSGVGVYLFGAQLEAGSFPTSYIKTTGATATRSADLASIPVADFGYNQGAGTLFVEAAPAALSSKNIFNLNVSGIDSESIYSNPDSSGHLIVRDTTTQVNLDAGSFVPNQTSKLAVVIKANDFAACLDSGNVVKDSAGTVPSPISNMHIGSTAPQSGIYSGHIKSIKYYPRRLTDAQLQELTT